MNNVQTIRNVKILGTGSYTPEMVYTNEYLSTLTDTSSDWIYGNLGIKERRVKAKEEATSDLAYHASKKALASANLDASDIDLIIVATTTPDRLAPSTACILQSKLGARNAAGFDLAAVCSGFIYALATGAQFIASGMYENVLIVGADSFSTIVDWQRRDCVFFGDGAGAAILAKTHDFEDKFMISKLYADGTGKDAWTIPAGGSEMPSTIQTLNSGKHYFQMDGKAVFDIATKVLPKAILEILKASSLNISDIKYIIPHQPSIKILKETARILGIDFSKVLTNMASYANTSAATIPILLDETVSKGLISEGDLIVFAAVGAGWTWGATVLKW